MRFSMLHTRQSYNRYTYALNNPLKYTDPNGYYSGPPPYYEGDFEVNNSNAFSFAFTRYVPNYSAPGNYRYTGGGQYEEYVSGQGWVNTAFEEVFDNFISPNGITISGEEAQRVFSDVSSGMDMYIVSAFGRETIVTAFGELGNMTISENGAISFSNPTTSGAYAGEAIVSGGSMDWNTATDGEKIIHIINSIRDARMSGSEYIDIRQLFSDFPKYGSGIDLIKGIKIGDNSMTVHMILAIYKNMQIDIYPARMGQVGPFNGMNVNGVIKEGYWNMMELNRVKGSIPMLMIQINANFDAFYNYLYK